MAELGTSKGSSVVESRLLRRDDLSQHLKLILKDLTCNEVIVLKN